MNDVLLAKADVGPLADWAGLYLVLGAFVVVVIALTVAGRRAKGFGPTSIALRVADSLERLTRIPGWSAAMVGTATFGLLVAGMGFYNDVQWHVALGRDEVLFTPPHTAIVIGLQLIAASAALGIWFATVTKAEVGIKISGLRVPWSALVMGLIGVSALAGFPLDELWHRQYGIDVTLWSPTHLLMVVGASVSPLASWLALSEAKVRPEAGRWAGGIHIAVGSFTLLGLSSVQGEFAFGVPQFQQLYHPVLFALAAGFALTAVALVVRRWWTPLIVAGIGVLVGAGDRFAEAGNSQPRSASLYITAAVAVALVAKIFGTEKRTRFAVASGLAVATAGLAGEWAWSQGGYQPWGSALLPEAPILAAVAAIGAAVIGVAFAGAIRREPGVIGGRALAVAGIALLVALAVPFPRNGSDVTARVDVTEEQGTVAVRAVLDPVDAADGARWFQLMAWQGGGFVRTDMKPTGAPGVYESEGAVPVGGNWKSILRLHRGAELSAIPIWLPADSEIGAPEVSIVDRTEKFVGEQQILLREQHPGAAWFSYLVYGLLVVVAVAWVTAFALTGRLIRRPVGADVAAGHMARI
jgi:hypothetical protein